MWLGYFEQFYSMFDWVVSFVFLDLFQTRYQWKFSKCFFPWAKNYSSIHFGIMEKAYSYLCFCSLNCINRFYMCTRAVIEYIVIINRIQREREKKGNFNGIICWSECVSIRACGTEIHFTLLSADAHCATSVVCSWLCRQINIEYIKHTEKEKERER